MAEKTSSLHEMAINDDDAFIISYPKSGNTWLRYMIACLLHPQDDIKLGQLDALLPDIHASGHDELSAFPGTRLFKAHDCFDPRCRKVIYIVRDPRDVAISSYYFSIKHGFLDKDCPIGDYLKQFCHSDRTIFGNWQENVGSWVGARRPDPDFFLLRYEDMLDDPQKALADVADHLGWQYSDDQIRKAAVAGRCKWTQQLEIPENKGRHQERDDTSELLFMRSDEHGQWKNELDAKDIAHIESCWGRLMTELGYELTTPAGTTIGPERATAISSPASTPSNEGLTIVTSIAPRGLDHQQKAIASWLALGFKVVSLNCHEEIDVLRDAFPAVGFVEVSRDGRAHTGRPLIYFDDILAYYRDTGDSICGIVNSDILIKDDPSFYDIIDREAMNHLVYGSRVDVQDMDNRAGGVYRGGFDFFFFPRTFIDLYPSSTFMIGMPWWDYWVPAIALLKGMGVKRLDSFYAFHEYHEINYSEEHYLGFGRQFATLIRPLLSAETEADFPLLNDIEAVDIPRLGANTTRFLEKHSLSLTQAGYEASPHNDSGEQLFVQGVYDQALTCFQKALQIAPDDIRTLNNLAVLSWQLGDSEAALAFVRQAYQIAPEDRNTVLNFIDIQSALEKYDEALRACQHYLTAWRHDHDMRELAAVLKKSLAAQMENALGDLVNGL